MPVRIVIVTSPRPGLSDDAKPDVRGLSNDITGHSRFRAYSFSDALDPDVSCQASNATLSPDPKSVIAFERLVGADYDIFLLVADDGDADNAGNVTVMQEVAVQDEQADPRISFEGNDCPAATAARPMPPP